MRPGLLAFVIVMVLGAEAGLAAPPVSPEAAARARQLMMSAVAHQAAGENHKAIEELSWAIKSKALSHPDLARAAFDRGVAYDAMGKTTAALSDYSLALRADPALAPALNNRANVYRRLGRVREAQRDYEAALKCPGVQREYPYYGLGLIAEKLGDIETARDYFHKALAMNPAFALAAQGLAGLDRSERQAGQPELRKSPRVVSALTRTTEVPAGAGPVLRPAVEEGGGSAVMVQLGAYRDEETALAGWDKIAAASDGALRGYSPVTVTVDLPGKGKFWRLRTTVVSKATARKLCEALNKRQLACMLARD